jgi:hypothetical protein
VILVELGFSCFPYLGFWRASGHVSFERRLWYVYVLHCERINEVFISPKFVHFPYLIYSYIFPKLLGSPNLSLKFEYRQISKSPLKFSKQLMKFGHD